MTTKRAKVKAWGGFVGGKLDWRWPTDSEEYGGAAVYKIKADARKHYEDVRRIVIEFPRGKTARKQQA